MRVTLQGGSEVIYKRIQVCCDTRMFLFCEACANAAAMVSLRSENKTEKLNNETREEIRKEEQRDTTGADGTGAEGR